MAPRLSIQRSWARKTVPKPPEPRLERTWYLPTVCPKRNMKCGEYSIPHTGEAQPRTSGPRAWERGRGAALALQRVEGSAPARPRSLPTARPLVPGRQRGPRSPREQTKEEDRPREPGLPRGRREQPSPPAGSAVPAL